MDQLINCLEKCSLVQYTNNKDTEFDCLIDSMASTSISESNIEWAILSKNYSKLRYLVELIIMFPDKSKKFYESVSAFFEHIDKVNQRYLREIDWYSEDDFINIKTMEAKFFLEQTLCTFDPDIKIQYMLSAYDHLVAIAEFYRNERFVDIIDDEIFLGEFN